MAATARLRHGADLIYFEDGTAYQLGDDFTPPGSSLAAAFTGGTSANRYGGSSKVDEKAANRELFFTVLCSVTTKDEAGPQALANRLLTMLSAAGDDNNPIWFEWTLTPDLPEPIWGQFGAWRRAEVVHAGGRYANSMGGFSRDENVEVLVSLTVKPFALGTRIYPASTNLSATTSLITDYFAANSFTPTGVRIPEAGTNLVANPVFANPSAWNTGWASLTSDVLGYEIIDPNYVYPGFERSAYLVASSTAGVYKIAVTTASTSAHYFSAWVKKPDSSAVTSADMDIYYNAALSTSFRLLGNGVYLATATAAGTTSADDAGVIVYANKKVYLLAFQVEQNDNHGTALRTGDMPGMKWDGVANNSSSSPLSVASSGGRIYIPADNKKYNSNVSVSLLWKTDYPSTDADASDKTLFSIGQSVHCFYRGSDQKIYLTQSGGASLSSSALTFAAGDTYRITATMGASGITLYINGVSSATSATWLNIATANMYFTLGSNGDLGSNGSHGIIRAFEIYDRQLTSTQVTALDTAFQSCLSQDSIDVPAVAANATVVQFPVATSPWRNYYALDNIPGDVSPIIDFEGINYTAADMSSDPEYRFTVLRSLPVNFVQSGLYYDSSSAAIAVSSSADEVLGTWNVYRLNELMGKTVYVAARLTDAGSNLQLDFKLAMGGTTIRIGYKNVVADATMRMFYLGPLYIPSRAAFPDRSQRNKNVLAVATLYAQRSTGGASNVELDYADIMLPDMLRILRTSAASISAPTMSYFDGKGALFYDAGAPAEQLRLIGTPLEIAPMAHNLIHFQPGTDATANATERTLTQAFYLTPRWSL